MKRNIAAVIKRVVTCFIFSGDEQVAVFRRCATMPTYPLAWAGISGTIEVNETPFQAAQRELKEETNLLNFTIHQPGGLFFDATSDSFGGRTIRVYPFTVQMNPSEMLQLRGTEHDAFQFITIPELLELENTVPGLARAFHHATFGKHLSLPTSLRQWANDRQSGATMMTRRAIELASLTPEHAINIAILRPTMVSVVNAMFAFAQQGSAPAAAAMLTCERDAHMVSTGDQSSSPSLLCLVENDIEAAVTLGFEFMHDLIVKRRPATRPSASVNGRGSTEKATFVIATFSRSGTIRAILQRLQEDHSLGGVAIKVLCSRSSPGGEGLCLAQDMTAAGRGGHGSAVCVEDDELRAMTREGLVDAVVVGADCLMRHADLSILEDDGHCDGNAWRKGHQNNSSGTGVIVNKMGTLALVAAARQHGEVTVVCCTDHWKDWDDCYAPPLENIFELVPMFLFDRVLIPERTT